MSKEEADRRKENGTPAEMVNAHNNLHHHHFTHNPDDAAQINSGMPLHSPRNDFDVEKTLDAAQRSTDKQTSDKGRRRSEEEKPDRTLLTHTQNDPRASTTLPIVQEAARENSSHHSSNVSRNVSRDETTIDASPQQSSNKDKYEEDEDQEPRTVEYTVKEDSHFRHSEEYHMKAPLDSHSQGHLILEPVGQRPEKPPRIGSGITAPLPPMYRDDEIGIAR